jgi:hypothetical protein
MEGEHAQMCQIPCKMTHSSSKPFQTLGKWYQPRNPKKIPKPAQKKNPKTISHPFSIPVIFLGVILTICVRQLWRNPNVFHFCREKL